VSTCPRLPGQLVSPDLVQNEKYCRCAELQNGRVRGQVRCTAPFRGSGSALSPLGQHPFLEERTAGVPKPPWQQRDGLGMCDMRGTQAFLTPRGTQPGPLHIAIPYNGAGDRKWPRAPGKSLSLASRLCRWLLHCFL
jgi:hypothetical protein